MNLWARFGGAGTILVLIGGCASAPFAPAPLPALDISARVCSQQPEIQHALSLSFEKKRVQTSVIDGSAPCFVAGPGEIKSTYNIFNLPTATTPYLVGVTSAPIGTGLFSPRLLLLDTSGAFLRELSRDTFQFHGTELYAAAQVRPDERYLVVASDPNSVGQKESQIAGSTQAAYVPVGIGGIVIYTGSEGRNTVTYAHSGKVTVELKMFKSTVPLY